MRSGERVTAASPIKEPTSIWSGSMRIAGAAKRRRAVHDDGVGADALDLGAERDQEMREVLHMRLGGGVAQIGGAVGGDRRDQRIFGGGDARLVEEDVGAPQLASRGIPAGASP